jgi:hypothetical protein
MHDNYTAMRAIWLTMVLLLFVHPVDAEQFMVIGYGNVSCGGWSLARHHRSSLTSAYEGWVEGYFTGYNQWAKTGPNIMGGTDIDGVDAAIDNFCTTHPLSTILEAAENTLSDLMVRKNNEIQNELAPLLKQQNAPLQSKK